MASHVFAGCYERFIFGFVVPPGSDDVPEEPGTLARMFTFAAHKHAVKCVASCGPYVASGGADDTIHLYDVQAPTAA
ncbi:hypothetical protein FOA52_011030 [Chlamydomonas sp. UWO 241]|nr:hypothetical protein FOA52_011030 [Chlamydomonas sp. UWO 241]